MAGESFCCGSHFLSLSEVRISAALYQKTPTKNPQCAWWLPVGLRGVGGSWGWLARGVLISLSPQKVAAAASGLAAIIGNGEVSQEQRIREELCLTCWLRNCGAMGAKPKVWFLCSRMNQIWSKFPLKTVLVWLLWVVTNMLCLQDFYPISH